MRTIIAMLLAVSVCLGCSGEPGSLIYKMRRYEVALHNGTMLHVDSHDTSESGGLRRFTNAGFGTGVTVAEFPKEAVAFVREVKP